MFKKFEEKENVSSISNMKTSAQRGIRNSIINTYPHIENYLDQILPKKDTLRAVKCQDHIEIVASKDGTLLFFKGRDDHWYPTLRLLHQYPFMMPHMQVDKGAIPYILSGANIMCPGLTSRGARMTPGIETMTVVAVMCENKEHAVGIGLTKMSTDEIRAKNKGVGIENIHYLSDGLWTMKPIKG